MGLKTQVFERDFGTLFPPAQGRRGESHGKMPAGEIGSQGKTWKLSVQKVRRRQFGEEAPVRPQKNQGKGTQGQKINGTRPFQIGK
jgi:hypothetical protein